MTCRGDDDDDDSADSGEYFATTSTSDQAVNLGIAGLAPLAVGYEK